MWTFYNEIWSWTSYSRQNCICYASEVCLMVINCAAQVTAGWSRWPTPLEVTRSQESFLTSHSQPAHSGRTHHTALKTTFETKGWWVKWLKMAACRLTLLILQLPLAKATCTCVFHPIRKGKVHVERHLSTVVCSETVYMSQSLKRQTGLNVNFINLARLELSKHKEKRY